MCRNRQCHRDLLDVVQRDVPNLTFHVGNEGPVETRLVGQSLLRPAMGAA
jgi:hypothetical protein